MSASLEPPAVPTAVPDGTASRIASVDLIRGAVMVLMAIDHVRVFSGLPAGGPTPGIFFTRWITHFCAPAFIFLAGTSAFLYGRRHADLSRFLLIRGLWLVLLELTVIRVAWTFNLDFAHYLLAGVIWVIGWCMVLMAGLVRLPLPTVGGLGLVIVALHNAVMPGIVPLMPPPLRALLYTAFEDPPIGPLMVLYSLLPWVGVMAAGYAFGRILTLEPARRDRICYAVGLGATLLFLLLRGFNLYGDPRPWTSAGRMPAMLAFLNTTKYPASLSFLLMTLGPTIALMPVLERTRGTVARWLTVFGRVPFFFYVLHIPLIHALALVVSAIRQRSVSPWLFANHPMGNPPPPEGYTWSLGLLYLVWAIAIVTLYLACRWFAGYKARRTDAWLRFV
ncbi:MAG: DUF1624 domain-containing protein [Gemmatimonadales bacterium]